MQKIKVAIVEDDKALSEQLGRLISLEPDFECVSIYNRSFDFLNDIAGLKADVVLMDISMPGINGIECVRQVKMSGKVIQVIMHTVFDDEEKIFDALKYGATGYILKGSTPSEIYESIRSVYKGGSPMSSVIARKVVNSFSSRHQAIKLDQALTEKEIQIVEQLAKGLRYAEIGEKMNISIDTVRTHIRHIYEKLQVNSRTGAINKVFPPVI